MKKTVLLFVLLFFMQGVYALGVSPGRTTVEFGPGLERIVEFDIYNENSLDMDVSLSVEGDLKDYVTLGENVISFNNGETKKNSNYVLNLPNGLSPGLYKTKIVITKLSDPGSEGQVVIDTTLSVVTQLYVYVAYEGKFIYADMNVIENQNTGQIEFYIPFVSRGTEDIDSVSAVIDIYKGDEKVDSLSTESLGVSFGQRKELKTVWESNISSGRYRAVATVDYDLNKINIEKMFNYDLSAFEILGITVSDFTLGQVAKLKIIVQSKLENPSSNVIAGLVVKDSDLYQIADLKSQSYEVPAMSNKEMAIYWDTENLEEGSYSGDLTLDYGSGEIDRNFMIEVSENMMIFSGVGFVVGSNVSDFNLTAILGIIIGILVIGNLLWFVVLKNRKNR